MADRLAGKYEFDIYTKSGSLLFKAGSIAKNRMYHIGRNMGADAGFTLDIEAVTDKARKLGIEPATLLGRGQNELRIKRRGKLLYSGRIWYDEGALYQDTKNLFLRSIDWFNLLAGIHTREALSYTNTDLGQMAANLVLHAQAETNGTYGITIGSVATGIIRNENYDAYKNIKEAIVQLMGRQPGFDMEITPEKVLNAYASIGVTRKEFIFYYPGNIVDFKPSYDCSKIINRVIARGALESWIENNTSSQEAYGIRSALLDLPDYYLLNSLKEAAKGAMQPEPLPVLQVTLNGSIEPVVGSFWIGDRVPVVIKQAPIYNNIEGLYRIEDITVNVDDDDNETIILKMTP